MNITSEVLRKQLKEFFGFSTFKPMQEDIIKHLVRGNNCFVLMPTGGGKSLCYQLPALLMEGTAVVVSPLIALMKNQVDAIRGFVSEKEGIAHFLNSSLNKAQVQEVRDNLLKGVTKLLYVAPESLTKEENIQLLRQCKISFYAIDEAHCISEWGHDFRPEYRRILPIVQEIGSAPIIALTATATPKVQSDILKNLGMADAKVFKSSFNRPNLYYEIRPKVNAEKEIIKFIRNNPGKSGIIYCLSRKKVEEMAQLLNVNGIKAAPYHAGLDAATRAENQDKFLMEEIDVIVATIAFGMGIDKPDVRFVIHYNIPKSLEGYYQETGRAGRDGGEGQCIAFYSFNDILKLEKFMQSKPVAEQEIGKQLLTETVAYAESNQCRRKTLLNYFGEIYPEDDCGNCDNCLHKQPTFEGKDYLVTLFQLIRSLKENFKSDHLANILGGVTNAMITSYRHNTNRFFGIDKEKDERFWLAVIRQACVAQFLKKDIEQYGLISLTDKGKEFLAKPYSVMLMEDRKFEESGEGDDVDEDMMAGGKKGGGGGDQTLLAILKDLRKDMSRKLNLPPYIIFTDPAIEDMTIFYPITLKELTSCSGVGEGKAAKYGKEFVELIKKYVEENEIERPTDIDMRIRSIGGDKTEMTRFIVHGLDMHIPLDEIARIKNLDMDELLTKIEAMVAAGNKVKIDYYIRQAVDEDKIEDIYDYFKEEAESDSVMDAMKALGGDYTEEEIRLIRIKFLTEVANGY
ncbi:MAG: DNA helicase RecQ [Bacteroidales bacterium]|nr:DNA helicase RecQ [Bacteroidales bacterium]